jgi:HlyD family secretion protein
MRLALPLLAVALAAAGCSKNDGSEIQGYVEAEYVRVAAPFAGTLVKLEVQRGQPVAAGAALFRLEAESEDAGRREAEQRARAAQAQLDDARKGPRATEVDTVRAQLRQAEVVATNAERELARTEDLVAKGFVSKQNADNARTERDRARARVAELRSQLATTESGKRPDEIRAAEAEAKAAQAALAQADWKLQQKSVASTVQGLVFDTLYVEGEWVPAGSPVVSLLTPQNVKVRFFVPEPRLASVRMGQAVTIRCDGCDPTPATVTYISRQAEYTPPVIYSKENRGKLVFMVEARPALEAAAKLHPGQPVDVVVK